MDMRKLEEWSLDGRQKVFACIAVFLASVVLYGPPFGFDFTRFDDPKIATVISVDRGRLAQMRVGSEFHFMEVDVETAQTELNEELFRLGTFAKTSAPSQVCVRA
jgi:hypothetical protein